MKWQMKYMTDPGDGIVTTKEFEHESDDIVEVVTDVWNGQIPGIPEDQQNNFNNGCWLTGIECIGV